MPALPRLAAPAPAPAPAAAPTVRRTPPALPPPLRPPCRACSLGSGRRPPRPPSATAADAPRGGPIPEPEEVDQHLLAALRAARIRDEESRRSDPLFIDPYAAVLLSHDVAHHHMDYLVSHAVVCHDHYRLTTRYIDDKLQNLVSNSEDIRQIVLLTDGMDTRPYRLSWPRLSVVYDVSPGKVFSTATRQLRGSGAKVSRNCVLLHTPLESPDLQEGLSKNGFNGNRLSLWVLQGLPLPTITSLENLLLVISNLAMKGSIFMGELPHFPGCTASMDMGLEQENLEKLFFTQGFQVSFVRYDDVVKDVGLDLATPWEQRGRLLFVAEQLRFSDAQMESFRMHFERIEEDADEDGFEEL
ncbi:hypothetical protein GQ55_2G073000 [Panicum hallii var. hallii]|uniref:S-adenosyl-L-methionine-dependent methyltransferase n=3 Tax=Panicum hallii TaxID=206008 RepID=A0A2T7EMD8_9POAL|nr:hypothetical protein GQ55_2G073000 [Panicum hallii var. hallii]